LIWRQSKGFCPALPRYRLAFGFVAPSAKTVPRTVFFCFAPSLFESLPYNFIEKMKGTAIVDTMQQFLLSVAFHNKTE
jgi:hypothetical protein